MVCPVCIATAIVANAPAIAAAAVGGAAAAKVALRKPQAVTRDSANSLFNKRSDAEQCVSRIVIDRRSLPVIASYDEDDF
eukprot:jgi/Chrzof1/4819/Cz15g00160.t1